MSKPNVDQSQALKKSIDLLVLIELCKNDASYDEIRKIMGKANNNLIASVKSVISKKKGK